MKRREIGQYELSLRWGDMDAYGHLNNATFFRFVEEARVQAFSGLGWVGLESLSTAPVVVTSSCTYLKQVQYPDSLLVSVHIDSPGTTSFMTHYELFSKAQSELVATAEAKVVWIDRALGKSVPLSDELRALFI